MQNFSVESFSRFMLRIDVNTVNIFTLAVIHFADSSDLKQGDQSDLQRAPLSAFLR